MEKNKQYNKRRKGSEFEDAAAKYLVGKGHRILAKNFRNRFGEIDIVSFDEKSNLLVFTEVKYRAHERAGSPEEAVTVQKQRNISLVAQYYIMKYGQYADIPVRFDVIAFHGEELKHIPDAFPFRS